MTVPEVMGTIARGVPREALPTGRAGSILTRTVNAGTVVGNPDDIFLVGRVVDLIKVEGEVTGERGFCVTGESRNYSRQAIRMKKKLMGQSKGIGQTAKAKNPSLAHSAPPATRK